MADAPAITTRGRPTKFVPETAKQIVENIKLGMPPTRAAQAAGVSAPTMSRWLQQPGKRFVEFQQAVQRAMPDLEKRMLEIAQGGALEDPHLAWKIVQGMHPERYSAYRANANRQSSVTLTEGDRSITLTSGEGSSTDDLLSAVRSLTQELGGSVAGSVAEGSGEPRPGDVRPEPGDLPGA